MAAAVLVLGALGLSGCAQPQPVPEGSPASGRPSTSPTPTIELTPTPPAEKIAPPDSGAYLGVHAPPAPFEMSAVRRFELDSGKPVSIVMWYQPWQTGNRSRVDSGTMVEVWRAGKVPMITWEPWDPGVDAHSLARPDKQPRYRLQRIIDGRYDPYIRSWAVQLRDLGGPVMLRPMHEMNGNWYPWCGTVNGNTPAEYVRAWKHIHDIFEAEGATNVTWVWSINHESVPSTPKNRYAAYYPGDRYVDWTGISGFNFGTTSAYSAWESFGHWYDEPLAYLATLSKPICVAEFGCVEQGGNKGAWITDAFKEMNADKRIKAIVYYNAREQDARTTQDWRITTSARAQNAYRAAVASDYYRGSIPPELSAWAGNLHPYEWRRLMAIQPLY